MPNERPPTKREMDRKFGFDTDAPTQQQMAKVLGCSARHIGSLIAGGHLTKGGDIRRIVSEWVEYQIMIRREGRGGRKPGGVNE
jgi:hypothetical protein